MQWRRRKKLLPLGAALLVLVGPLGCVEEEVVVDRAAISSAARPAAVQGIPVAEVVAAPARFRDREVTVYGQARAGLALEFVGEQPYRLEMGGKGLWVITSTAVPAAGSWVTVRGVVRQPYQLKGRHYPLALVETDEEGR